MFRAPILSLAVVVSAAACSPVANLKPYTNAEIAAMEEANAVVVQAAAKGCGQPENVYAYGAHGGDIAADYAETLTEHELLDIERCMQSNLAVAQAATEVGLLDVVVLQPYGQYGYTPAFEASNTDAEMVATTRGLREAIDRRLADRFH